MGSLPKIFVDGVLLDWGDRIFSPPYRCPTAARSPAMATWVNSVLNKKPAKIRAQIERTARRTPEVMVKITNRHNAGRGMKAIRAHLDYISRNGKVELEDQDGDLASSRNDVKDLQRYWEDGVGVPEESPRREAFNVILSMPAGTPSQQVLDAARDFLQEEFEGREYVFGLHTDTPRPHVHVCILAAAARKGQKRLNPKRADLQRWREGFADRLRQRGIDANATPRRTRGEIGKRGMPISTYHAMKRKGRDITEKPLASAIEHANTDAMTAWREIADVLAKSEVSTDPALAKQSTDFVMQTPLARLLRGETADGQSQTMTTIPVTRSRSKEDERQDKHRRQWWRKASVYQSDLASNGGGPPPAPPAGLRHLSGIAMVQNQRCPEMLLHPDARDLLGRGGGANHDLRRPNPRPSGAGKGVAAQKSSANPLGKRR
ncbi:relaxase/mobilization nuclease domain-containing protein [bacterium]|nr:relaxase/mobilization nuclease domain-containing protein [bacterium]